MESGWPWSDATFEQGGNPVDYLSDDPVDLHSHAAAVPCFIPRRPEFLFAHPNI